VGDRGETSRLLGSPLSVGPTRRRERADATRRRVSAFIVFLSASIASRADAVVATTHGASRSDRTRGVDTFRFTKVLSKPTTVSRLEHVVRGRMKRARRGDGRQALVAALVGALVAISIAPLRARAAPFPADGANLKTAVNNCLAADATGACDCSSSSVDCEQGNGLAIGSWDTSQVFMFKRHLCLEHGRHVREHRSLQPRHLCLEYGGGDDVRVRRCLQNMFGFATAFNQDISAWNTAAVTNMYACSTKPQPSTKDISAWNTAKVTTMELHVL